MCYCDSHPDPYSESWRKARKLYRCCECGVDINPGEHYFRISGIWEHGLEHPWQTFKQCGECRELWELVDGHAECLCFSMLDDEVYEHIRGWYCDEDRTEWWKIARKYVLMQRRVRASWERYQAEKRAG